MPNNLAFGDSVVFKEGEKGLQRIGSAMYMASTGMKLRMGVRMWTPWHQPAEKPRAVKPAVPKKQEKNKRFCHLTVDFRSAACEGQ